MGCALTGAILLSDTKEAGSRPLRYVTGGLAAGPKMSDLRIARAVRSALRGPAPREVAIAPVVRPLGAQVGGERERMAGLVVAAELLQRAAEAEQREVVRRGVLDDGLELGGGGLVLLGPEEG